MIMEGILYLLFAMICDTILLGAHMSGPICLGMHIC